MMNDDEEPNPWVVLFWGAPAAGKSTLANRLVEYCAERGQLLGHLGTDRLNATTFGGQFDGRLRDGLYEGMFTMAAGFLSAGRSLVIEGTFLRQEQRQRLERLCEERGARLLSVCVECPLPARLLRNRHRSVTERVPEKWLRRAHGLAAQAPSDLRVDTYRLAAESAFERVLELLNQVPAKVGCSSSRVRHQHHGRESLDG